MPRNPFNLPEVKPTICIPLNATDIVGVTRREHVFINVGGGDLNSNWVKVHQPAEIVLVDGNRVKIPDSASQTINVRPVLAKVLSGMQSAIINPKS